MSIEWQNSVRNHDGKQVRGLKTAGSVPAALSQNPLTDGRFGAEQPLIVHANGRPALGFWDFVYWATWGVVGMLCLIMAASVAKAIRYGVITDIINWMLGR